MVSSTEIGLLISLICLLHSANAGVVGNFTVIYEYVASDEIVILQNAIEDVGFISTMQVRPISMFSEDVPTAPLNVSAIALSDAEIKVLWTEVIFAKGNLTIVGYTVFYKRILDSGDNWQRLSTTSSARWITLTNLMAYTTYTIRVVAFHDMGNGIASQFVDEKTMEGYPAESPANFTCVSENPSTITLTWQLLDSTLWNGVQKEYTTYYKIYNSGTIMDAVKFGSSKRTGILLDLAPYTKYEIYFVATNNNGDGPKAWCVVDTQEGVPSVGPKITFWELDPLRPLEAIVTWDQIPEESVHGRLTGYKINYGVSRNGKKRYSNPEMKSILVNQYTTQIVLSGFLEPSMELTVTIAGLTRIGEGTLSAPVYVETCNCPISIYSAWFVNKPYTYKNRDGSVAGIFPDYMGAMIHSLCADCFGLKRGNSKQPSTLYWDRSKDGHSPLRNDEKDLKERVADNVHFHVAMFGRSEIENFQSDYRFVSIVQSPGSAFIVRDPLAELDKTSAIMGSLFNCWPAIIIIFLLSMVAGTVVWFMDCQSNAAEFPNESFLKGVYHGTYWAFVSMTTVGYGDKVPVSFMAQCVTIIWMFMGPIINGVVIAAITTSLTSINLEEDPHIYGNNIGAIFQTFEYNLGVRRNGKMNSTGYIYKDTTHLLKDLENRVIDGILIDSLVAADKADVIAEKKLKLSKVIPEASGWGLILSSDMLKLEEDIRSYVRLHEEEMQEMVDNRTNGKLTVKAKPPSSLDTGIVDPKSKMFKNFVYYGLTTYVLLCVLGLAFEHGYLRMRNRRIVPYSQEHRELLENDLSGMMKSFAINLLAMIKDKSSEHDSELKTFFWKKGYSFGIDGWLKQKTMDEDSLKKNVRYNEIMYKDLDFEKNEKLKNNIKKWQKGKKIIAGAIRVMPKNESTV